MLKKNSLIHLFFLFICTANIPSTTHCGDYKTKHQYNINHESKSFTQLVNKKLSLKRKECGADPSGEKALSLFPKNVIVEKALPGARPGSSFHVAMRETLGLSPKQFNQIENSIIGCQDWVNIIHMPYNFFDRQELPTPECLATYTPTNNFLHINHFAVATDNGRIKSKFGISPYIIEHDYFDLPDYGEEIYFWKLSGIYNGEEGKTKLFTAIMCRIKEAGLMKQKLKYAQDRFFALAANKEHHSILSSFHRVHIDNKDPLGLLQTVMGLDINKLNSDGETALTLASQRGDEDFVRLLIEYHANPNLTNKDGFTALELAQQNNHPGVVKLLQQKNPYKKPLLYCSITAVILAIAYYFYNHLSSQQSVLNMNNP